MTTLRYFALPNDEKFLNGARAIVFDGGAWYIDDLPPHARCDRTTYDLADAIAYVKDGRWLEVSEDYAFDRLRDRPSTGREDAW